MELIVIAVVGVLIFVRLSRRRGADPGAIHGPVGWSDGTDWRVVLPLARADARFVLTHPAFVVGVVLTPLMLYWSTSTATDWREASTGTALALVPLGWFTIVATNLVAWRPRRTGSEELFATLPAPSPVRTAALLVAAAAPVLVAAVIVAGWVAYLGAGGDAPTGTPEWAEIAAGLAIVAGSVCVGVAVARWLPSPGFGVVAAVATIIIQARFLDVTTWPWDRGGGDPLRFLAFLAGPARVGDNFLEIRPAAWHLLYLVGLVVLMAGVALARDGIRRPVVVILTLAAFIVVGAGWQQTRPASAARESEMVSFLTEPTAHQVCEKSTGVSYCAYPSFVADIGRWREAVESTLDLLPPAAIDGRVSLTVRQRAAIMVSDQNCEPVRFDESLPPGVLERVSPGSLWPADGLVHPAFSEESFPCSEREVHGLFLGVQTGAWAVGLPPAPHGDNERCTADHQARSVIALWAGAAAVPEGGQTLTDVIQEGSTDSSIVFDEWDDPPMWGVDYAVADAELAVALLDRPTAEVQEVLGRDWDHWADPRTSSAELAEQFDIDHADTAPTATCP